MVWKTIQKEIVFEIVKDAGAEGIRTEWVKIKAMREGVSCADRYLRWLLQEGRITKTRRPGDRTDTWFIVVKENETKMQEVNKWLSQ